MTTKAENRQDVADIAFSKDRFRRGTANAAGNSQTLIVDDALKASIVRPTRLIDAWALITSGACEGGIAGIEQYDNANGKLTLDGGLFVDPGEGFTYELFYPPFDPVLIEGESNEFMRRTRVDALWIPSLIPDSELDSPEYSADGTGVTTVFASDTLTDLRAEWVTDEWVGYVVTCNSKTMTITSNTATVLTGSGAWSADPGQGNSYAITLIDTNWPDVGTPTTKNLNTAAANVYLGERSLYVLATADSGFKSVALTAFANERLTAAIIGRASAGNFTVSLQNATATVTYDSATLAENVFTLIRLAATMPGSAAAPILHVAANTTAAGYFAAPIVLQSQDRREYAAPTWLKEEGQILDAVTMGFGLGGVEDQTYYPLTGAQRTMAGIRWLASARAVHPLRTQFRQHGENILAFMCQRPLSVLRNDSDTSPVDREFAAAAVTARVLKKLGIKEWKEWDREARKLARRHSYNRGEIRSESPLISV